MISVVNSFTSTKMEFEVFSFYKLITLASYYQCVHHVASRRLITMIVTRANPMFAPFAMLLESGPGSPEEPGVPGEPGVLGESDDTFATSGSGGSTISAISRLGDGATAGGFASGTIWLMSDPGSAGKMAGSVSKSLQGDPAKEQTSWEFSYDSTNFHISNVCSELHHRVREVVEI